MYRYPFTPFPNGWYCAAHSSEVTRGSSLRVTRLGRELLVFRGESGVASVCDAYCPHLGADLGVASRVVGDTIECPFHGWRFDGGGTCVRVPYSDKIPQKARIQSWPTVEKDGIIFFFFDAENRPPQFTIPDGPFRAGVRWSEPLHFKWKIRLHIQEVAENALDTTHFPMVHAYASPPSIKRFELDGPRFTVELDTCRQGMRFVGTTPMTIAYHGLGVVHANMVSFLGHRLPFEAAVILTTTPIDEEHCEVRILERHVISRIPWQLAIRPVVAREIATDFENDIPIWESKRYLEAPVLCKDDGPIGTVRSWARQFYSDIGETTDLTGARTRGAA